jgi:hypothetical protein
VSVSVLRREAHIETDTDTDTRTRRRLWPTYSGRRGSAWDRRRRCGPRRCARCLYVRVRGEGVSLIERCTDTETCRETHTCTRTRLLHLVDHPAHVSPGVVANVQHLMQVVAHAQPLAVAQQPVYLSRRVSVSIVDCKSVYIYVIGG